MDAIFLEGSMIHGFLTLHDCTSLFSPLISMAKCWPLGYTLKSGYGDQGTCTRLCPIRLEGMIVDVTDHLGPSCDKSKNLQCKRYRENSSLLSGGWCETSQYSAPL